MISLTSITVPGITKSRFLTRSRSLAIVGYELYPDRLQRRPGNPLTSMMHIFPITTTRQLKVEAVGSAIARCNLSD